jgi:ferredoxin-like protein FixX
MSYTLMHTCMPTYQMQTRVHATYVHSSAQRNSIYHAQTYTLMRASYVLHSLECLECGVVDQCCSNVLRSLRAYGVVNKAVRTCV